MKKFLIFLLLFALAVPGFATLASVSTSYTTDDVRTGNRYLALGSLAGATSAQTGVTVSLTGFSGFMVDLAMEAYDGTVEVNVANSSTGPWRKAYIDNTTNNGGTAVAQTKNTTYVNNEGWKYLRISGDPDAGACTVNARLLGKLDIQKVQTGLSDIHAAPRAVATVSASTATMALQEFDFKGSGCRVVVNAASVVATDSFIPVIFWKNKVTGLYTELLTGAAITNTTTTGTYVIGPPGYTAAANATSLLVPSTDTCLAVGTSDVSGTNSFTVSVIPIP